MWTWLIFAFAVFLLILIPYAPQLVRLRIKIVRWLNWNWAVNLLESHFQGWVVFFRIMLLAIAVVMFVVFWTRI